MRDHGDYGGWRRGVLERRAACLLGRSAVAGAGEGGVEGFEEVGVRGWGICFSGVNQFLLGRGRVFIHST